MKNKFTPLMIAAKYGRTKNVEVLLSHADSTMISLKDRNSMAAIHYAAEGGYLDIIKLLVEKGADINMPGKNRLTPLLYACANGHFECVQWLVENEAKLSAKDKYKKGPLIAAVTNGNLKIASYLIRNGADVNQADSSDNRPIHYAAAYGYDECVDLLIRAGANQNLSTSWKLTPLTVAMLKNNLGTLNKLLSYKSTNVDCKDEEGKTLIMYAIESLSKSNLS
mmetsp:Transcript_41579/g.36951  ORF Transcript_41579/g.36951 Transcript_41579/m.36951 type:complete len:223 (+) Transcript_41579:1781-2449(+)